VNRLVEIEKQYQAGRFSKKAYINLMYKQHLALWKYSDLIKNKNIASIEINQDGIIFKTKDGLRLICDSLDKRHMFLEVLNFGDYESAELRMIKRFLKKDSVVLDIGANVGWYAVNLSKSVPQGEIIAFEPIPKTYGYLVKNITLNGLSNIKTYNIGLAEKAGYFNFFYNRKYTGAASLMNIINQPDVVLVKCRVEKLDDFFKKLKIEKVDFIKCDVEGAEKFVIEGGLGVIKKNNPVIFMELLRKWSAKFGYHPNSIIDTLKNLGYGCYLIHKAKLRKINEITQTTQESNFCFLRMDKHSKLLSRLI
jgi:FkbM family methyltransferase